MRTEMNAASAPKRNAGVIACEITCDSWLTDGVSVITLFLPQRRFRGLTPAWDFADVSLRAWGNAPVKRQNIHTFPPVYGVEANNGRLAGEFDRRYKRIEFGGVEIALELLARLPVFNHQQGLASVEIRIQAGIEAARSSPRWSEHGAERAQQNRSSFIRGYDLQ
jgi:hypothetical protein